MPTRQEALAELYRRDELNDTQKAAVEELARRGEIDISMRTPRTDFRIEAMQELAEDIGPLQAFLIGAGKGFTTVGRGLGLVEPAGEIEKEAMAALKEERPYTTGAGKIVGEAAPFVPLGMGVGAVPGIATRALAGGAMGAVEAGLIEAGEERDILRGAGIGAGIGLSAEILFPVIGKLARKIFQKVKGVMPRGAMLDAAGKPTQELLEALETAGMSFDDLTEDAVEMITKQKPGADPAQIARRALFAEEGIPAMKGEITQEFEQRAIESRLLEAAGDTASEPLRQYKLKQSEKIKDTLRAVFGGDPAREETGQLIQDTLIGRKRLLRTQKNELYEAVAKASDDIGGVPVFTDSIADVIPDEDLMEDLAITAPQAINSLDQILTKYGLKEPTEKAIEAGFEPVPLTIANSERFRKTLNAISRGDQTGAVNVAIGPIKEALDSELDELAGVLKAQGVSAEIFEPLKQARKTVRQIKTEFSPQSLIGRIIDVKKDGVTQITEASKVYDKIIGKATPVEGVRGIMKSLAKSPKGEQTIASLQATTIFDLIDAGFGTESRKISGIKTFNPIAFKRRLKSIGPAKLKAIFRNNPEALKKINNIDKISSELVPPAGAVPKGSASVILDLMNNLGLASISTKIPGGAFLVGTMQKIAEPIKTGVAVGKALKPDVDITKIKYFFDDIFPGITSAIAIPTALEVQGETE